jgi:DNA-binding winged helix-turn-helix (wHTH) protein
MNAAALTTGASSRGVPVIGRVAPVGEVLSFPPYILDLGDERLWMNGHVVALRQKPFAVLRHLARNPQRLVTHEELAEAVWGKIAMSESLLRTHIRDLRQALGVDFIETVAGRGYRFVASVTDTSAKPLRIDDATTDADGDTRLIARGDELLALDGALRGALVGKRATIFVTGQAGAGKTALVDSFVLSWRSRVQLCLGRANCAEHQGSGEAYSPLLQALGNLCRGRRRARVVEILLRHAPSWLAQMPGLVATERLDELQKRVAGGGHPRMLREFVEAVEALSIEAPVVIALEDLQWSDGPTVDVLAALARRRESARVLTIGVYRSTELDRSHPLYRLRGELVANRLAEQVELAPFDDDAIGEFLERVFPNQAFPADFARHVLRFAGGNPRFVRALIDDLVEDEVLRWEGSAWALNASAAEAASHRARRVLRLANAQLDRLTAPEQRVLEVGAVMSTALFTPAAIARALDRPIEEIDALCHELATWRALLRRADFDEGPDGAQQPRYTFAQASLRDAAASRSSPLSRRSWLKAAQRAGPERFGHTDWSALRAI